VATPTRAEIHIAVAATNISVLYRNQKYIADQILPVVKVAKPTGTFFKFEKSSWFRDEAGVRLPGTLAPEGEWRMDTAGSYSCVPYSFAHKLPDEIREIADDPLKPERTAVEFATDKILLAREVRVATKLFNSTTFAGYTAACESLSGGAQVHWDTLETSDPIRDVEAMRTIIRKAIGFTPNVMVVGMDVDVALQQHPEFIERIKYTQTGVVTNALIAQMFKLDKYLVGDAMYTTVAEGATASYSVIWGKSVLLAYVTPSPALESPSLGYIIEWKSRTAKRYSVSKRT
jgi:hypothetical protein